MHVKSQHIGYVLVALQAAFYVLQHTENFTDSLVDTVELGGCRLSRIHTDDLISHLRR